MSDNARWLLPEGIEEMLPVEAQRFERARRAALDLFARWGYELVMPPLIEYLDSLLTGTGKELDIQTFKLIDELSGRLMGVRADLTPQAARIDAHYLKRECPVRLCYVGSVLRTRPGEFAGNREPVQIGAELFGDGGPDSEVEILQLMRATLTALGVREFTLDLGHVGVFHELSQAAKLTRAQQDEIFDVLQRKAKPEIDGLLARWDIGTALKKALAGLVDWHGDAETLQRAEPLLRDAGAGTGALAQLRALADTVRAVAPTQALHFDLAELHGYRYYTGVVFSAFMAGHGSEIARGGRYDDIGKAFGRARAAVGFGIDLRQLLKLIPAATGTARGVLAPIAWRDAGLQQAIDDLRARGERVVWQLGGEAAGTQYGCDRVLVRRDGRWQVEPITK